MASRYTSDQGARRAWVPHKDQGLVEIVYRKPPLYNLQPYVDYLVTAADDLFGLAWREYKDSTSWWRLADLNPGIVHPDDMTFGTLLHIPVIRQT